MLIDYFFRLPEDLPLGRFTTEDSSLGRFATHQLSHVLL